MNKQPSRTSTILKRGWCKRVNDLFHLSIKRVILSGSFEVVCAFYSFFLQAAITFFSRSVSPLICISLLLPLLIDLKQLVDCAFRCFAAAYYWSIKHQQSGKKIKLNCSDQVEIKLFVTHFIRTYKKKHENCNNFHGKRKHSI